MGEDTISWWEDLIKSNLQEFEKEVNPHGISYFPPNSWPDGLLERLLKDAYRRENPQAAPPNPLPAPAIYFLTVQLNKIFNERGRGGDHQQPRPQLTAYLTQSFPKESAWNHVDVVQHDTGGNLAAGRSQDINTARTIPEIHKTEISSSSRPIPKESYKSDDTTLPFASRSGGSSAGTGVGTSSRPVPGNSTPNKLTRGESETGHPSRKGSRGRTTRAGTRRASEPTSPSSSKRSRGVHACSQCHKTFPFPSKLKDHMHIHEETKDYSCGVGSCSKAFKRLRELQAHRKTHGEIPTPEPRNVDKEMYDSAGQSPADPEPPDPGLPNKSPQDSKSPAKSPPGEAFHKESLSTPPHKPPSITHGESPALPTMPGSPEHSGVSQEPQGDDEKSKDDRPRVPLENPGEYLTRMAAGLLGSRQ